LLLPLYLQATILFILTASLPSVPAVVIPWATHPSEDEGGTRMLLTTESHTCAVTYSALFLGTYVVAFSFVLCFYCRRAGGLGASIVSTLFMVWCACLLCGFLVVCCQR
jgi:hypothetical protein